MVEQIVEYILAEKEKLDNREVDVIYLYGVYPDILEEVFEEFEDSLDINGWQGDYWTTTENYSIFGTMYYGTAKIRLKEEE